MIMFAVTIQRNFNVSVAQLFNAWCKPEVIQKWFAPGNMTVPEASADVREGGNYRIVMHDADTQTEHIIGGEYKKVIENETLIFSWQWEGNPVATHIVINFKALSDNTSELVLTHSEFTDQQACDEHEHGWNGCLENLLKAL
jgi:uncharacterized protein YndB with AHSA1/START domain